MDENQLACQGASHREPTRHDASKKPVGSMCRLVRLSRASVLLICASLNGCAVVTKIERASDSSTGCTGFPDAICGMDPERPQRFDVFGQGSQTCETILFRTGTGGSQGSGPHDFNTGPKRFEITYGARVWPGIKRVRATGLGTCLGEAYLGVRMMERVTRGGESVFTDTTNIAFAQPPLDPADQDPCKSLPDKSALRRDSVVTVRSDPDPTFRINYGCWFSACIYDADGEPGSSAPTGWSFPGLRQYSLVLRVGGLVVQGGNVTRFRTTESGPLEFCLNDMNGSMNDNYGKLKLSVTVDEDVER